MNKRPIVIVASTRSGSSAYASYIACEYNLKLWSEPNLTVEGLATFERWLAAENKNYVLKIIARQLVKNEVYQTILKTDCYKIKLTRANKIDRIVSLYIADYTNIWNSYDRYARGIEYIVDINMDLIKATIKDVINNDRIIDNLDIDFDETLTYEELISTTNLDNTGVVKIIPPTNYDEIKAVIEEEYAKYR